MNSLKIILMLVESSMTFNTRKLILELLNQELRKSNRIPTLMYHEEIKEAKKDFLKYLDSSGEKNGL
jgi:hypothetical protein